MNIHLQSKICKQCVYRTCKSYTLERYLECLGDVFFCHLKPKSLLNRCWIWINKWRRPHSQILCNSHVCSNAALPLHGISSTWLRYQVLFLESVSITDSIVPIRYCEAPTSSRWRQKCLNLHNRPWCCFIVCCHCFGLIWLTPLFTLTI